MNWRCRIFGHRFAWFIGSETEPPFTPFRCWQCKRCGIRGYR